MAGLTLGQAKLIAVLAVAVLVIGAVLAVWLAKEVMQKLALAVILGLLALLVWTQRTSLQDCAELVREQAAVGLREVDTTCSFFGQDITISTTNGD